MVERIFFEQQGPGAPIPPPSALTPPNCNVCQYTEWTGIIPGWFDSMRDAAVAYQILFVRFARAEVARGLWTDCWKAFECPPAGKNCNIRAACENTPWFIEGGAQSGPDPADGAVRWQLYFRLGRRIKCVNDGPGTDVVPEIPAPAAPPRPPATPPSPAPPSQMGYVSLGKPPGKGKIVIAKSSTATPARKPAGGKRPGVRGRRR